MQPNNPQFQEIADFVKDLRFKKVLFGANTADVFACMQDLNAMYNDALIAQQKEQSAIEDELRERLAEKENWVKRLAAELETLKHANWTENVAPPDLQSQPERKESASSEEMNIVVQALTEMKRNMEATTAQAERNARAIVAQAKLEGEELLNEVRRQADREREQRQEQLAEVEHLRLRAKQVLDFTHGDFSGIVAEVDALRKKIDALSPVNAKAAEHNVVDMRRTEEHAAGQ